MQSPSNSRSDESQPKAQTTISIRNLSIEYRVAKYNYNGFKEMILAALKRREQDIKVIHALRDINLDIHAGESVALVGHNGSGKSTLLKCIAGVIRARNAQVETKGRIAPLIELGAGFDLELSGLENIRLSCTLMGLSDAEINQQIHSIIKFSELEDFIDIPLKNYSSGMYARLGFACATAVDPEILLIDEVMAVGDANFSAKCLDRIHSLKKSGTTVVLVSHSLETIREFCDRAFVFNEGEIRFVGDVEAAISAHSEIMNARYLKSLDPLDRAEVTRLQALKKNVEATKSAKDNKMPEVSCYHRLLQDDDFVQRVDVAKPFSLQFSIRVSHAELLIDQVSIGMGLTKSLPNDDQLEVRIGGCNNLQLKRHMPIDIIHSKSEFTAEFLFAHGIPSLAAGTYNLILGVHDDDIRRNIATRVVGQIQLVNSSLGFNHDEDIIGIRSYLDDIRFDF